MVHLGTAYVANAGNNQSSISVIDTCTWKIKDPIKTSQGQSYLARRVLNNQLWYISNSGQVGVARLSDHAEIAKIKMPHKAAAVALTPDGSRAYVSGWSEYGDGFAGHIWILNTATKKIIGKIFLGFGSPTDIALSPDNKWIYIASEYDEAVIIVNRITRKVDSRLASPDGAPGYRIAMSPAKNRAYVSYIDGVFAIDLSTRKQVADISMEESNEIAITPDQKYLYVNRKDYFSVVNLATNTIFKSFKCLGGPRGLAMTPDNRYVYITQYNKNRIAIYSRTTGHFVKTVPAGVNPVDVVITK